MSVALLNQSKAFIFRIVHRDNMAGVLSEGMHCRSAPAASKPYVQIGNADLIERRHYREVPHPPGGMLSNYVPFYFTPYSPMMYNIKTGYQGVQRRPSEEIVICVSSLYKLRKDNIPFVFSDRHAYLKLARFSDNPSDLDWIDWPTLQERNFRRGNVDRFERYQAEALVHNRMPTSALLGVGCYNDAVAARMSAEVTAHGLTIKILVRPEWYL